MDMGFPGFNTSGFGINTAVGNIPKMLIFGHFTAIGKPKSKQNGGLHFFGHLPY